MITEKILEKVNNLPGNTNEKILELEQSNSENKTIISTLENRVDNIYGSNENLNNKHFLKSYPGKYFSVVVDEKDLNNIKYNLICYTTSNDGLVNLPNGETGGDGILEVTQTFTNSSSQHTIQRYTNTITNIMYARSFNKDKNVWTDWSQINGGQNHKLTEDDGRYIQTKDTGNIDEPVLGWFNYYNAKGTLPSGYSPNNNDFLIENKGVNTNWIRQTLYDVRSSKKFERMRLNGSWSDWREL